MTSKLKGSPSRCCPTFPVCRVLLHSVPYFPATLLMWPFRCHDRESDHPNEHANRMIWYTRRVSSFFRLNLRLQSPLACQHLKPFKWGEQSMANGFPHLVDSVPVNKITARKTARSATRSWWEKREVVSGKGERAQGTRVGCRGKVGHLLLRRLITFVTNLSSSHDQ